MKTKLIDMSDPKAVAAATDEQFEASRAAEPWASLQHEHVCDRMTDEQFERSLIACADKDVSAYPWVTERRYTNH